jgi:hypothetical protein
MAPFSLPALLRGFLAPLPRRAARLPRRRPGLRPTLESLEDRLTPTSTAINVPPTQTVMSTATLTYSAATGNAITVSGDTTGAIESIFLQSSSGTMRVTNTAGGAALFNNGTAGVGISGTESQINGALDGLVFTPVTSASSSTQWINGLVITGTATAQTLVNVIGTGIFASPTVSGPTTIMVPDYVKQTVFSAVRGNAITVNSPDAGTIPVAVYIQSVQGSFTVPAPATGVTVTGQGTNLVSLSGTVTAINAALNGLFYQLWPGVTSDFFNVKIVDVFGTTNRTNTATLGTTVTAVATTSPTISGPSAITVLAGVPTVFSPANGNAITITDPAAGTTIPVAVYIQGLRGSFTVPSTPGVTVTVTRPNFLSLSGTVPALNAALDGLTYQINAGATSDIFNVLVVDNLGFTNRTQQATLTVTVTPGSASAAQAAATASGSSGASAAPVFATTSGPNGPTVTVQAPSGDTLNLNPSTGIIATIGGVTFVNSTSAAEQVLREAAP